MPVNRCAASRCSLGSRYIACMRVRGTDFDSLECSTMPKPFPMNAWYAAGWDAEVKRALLPRTVCGKHIVMYRKADGEVAALEDACWHRLVPLSKGKLEGDTVVCGYHLLRYNPQGR